MGTAAGLRHTPLTDRHAAQGARLVDFSGFLMPVQYDGILDEARRVRSAAGFFDLCHMGRCRLVGERRVEAAQFLVHVNVAALPQGAIRYSFFAREDGTTMDDVLIYKDADEVFFCINAGNRARDLAWMDEVAGRYGARLEDQSDELAMLAIQGPRSQEILTALTDLDLAAIKYYRFARGQVGGVPTMVSRTGYTGEDGFELCFEASHAPRIWDALLELGRPHGATPIGLAARDVLRLEAGMALYGHELDDTTNPVEAGLVIEPIKHKHDFSGRAAIERVLAEGPARKLVGFTTESKRVPRQGYDLVTPDLAAVGRVCSGSPSPTLGTNIGTAYVAADFAAPGTQLAMDVKGVRHEIQLRALPFYQRPR